MIGVWMLVLVAGTCQQFGFSAWAAMPGHYRDRVSPQDVATAEGLLLTAGGLGGFVVPVIFGMIAGSTGYIPAFLFGGSASIVFALFGFAAQEPTRPLVLSPSETQENILSEQADDIEVGRKQRP
jgi:nitrate/nitrite transporter NarK